MLGINIPQAEICNKKVIFFGNCAHVISLSTFPLPFHSFLLSLCSLALLENNLKQIHVLDNTNTNDKNKGKPVLSCGKFLFHGKQDR